MLKIVEKSKIWFAISSLIILVGLFSMATKGLNLGIDFKGGTVVDIKIGQQFNVEDVRQIAVKYDAGAQVQQVEGDEVAIRSNTLTDEQIPQLFGDLKAKYGLKDDALRSTERIGPSIGQELRKNAVIATLLALLGMLIYITIRFEFKFGMAAMIKLVHDLLVTVTVYALFQLPVNSSFIAAMLTILGYSINDAIVVFDRIRENRKLHKYNDYVTLVNGSLTQTMARSINTGLAVLIALTCLYIFGVSAVREFALPIVIGITSGLYSSIFIASPLWVIFVKKQKFV
jgi:preprotein translocase subunit SecF